MFLTPKRAGIFNRIRGPGQTTTRTKPRSMKPRARSSLERLQVLVRSAPKERRRELLEQMPMNIRKALLCFMEASKSTPTTLPPCVVRHKARLTPVDEQQKGTSVRKVVTSCTVSSPAATHGVSRKNGGYVARLTMVPYLHVSTRCMAKPDCAKRFHNVLARARSLLAAQGFTGLKLRGSWLQAAIKEACTEADLVPADLGLSFCAVVDASCLIGRAIAGSYSTDIDQALSQRQRFLEARAEGSWQQLRAEWVNVMTSKEALPRIWGHVCVKPMNLEDAEKVADAARRRHAEKTVAVAAKAAEQQWKILQRRLSKVVATLSKILAYKDRRQQMAESRKRKRMVLEARLDAARDQESKRRERLRWLRDPARTLEDLMPSAASMSEPAQFRKHTGSTAAPNATVAISTRHIGGCGLTCTSQRSWQSEDNPQEPPSSKVVVLH